MSPETPITETDLHAYVDGQLSPARRKLVAQWLVKNPEAMQEINDYQQLDQALHDCFDPVLEEPLPGNLKPSLIRFTAQRIAAIITWMSIGVIVGWTVNSYYTPVITTVASINNDLIQPAVFAHSVYATDLDRPVEIQASDEKHLVSWISKRLHKEILPPNLAGNGYAMIGGRLLPSTNRMAAQYMYRNQHNKRITLYVRRIAGMKTEPMFRYAHDNNIKTFYWVDNSLGYALSGDIDKNELLVLANSIYLQLYKHQDQTALE